MKKRLRFLGSRLLSALRLALGALLFTPVLALLVAVNYGVDCQGYFLGDTYLREIATMLFEGKAVVGFEQLKDREREVIEVIVANMDETTLPQTIALGSSRILQLTQEMVGTSFYNSGTSGGDFYDVLSAFYVYDKAGKLPENVIIGIDPWLFNADSSAQDDRSDKTLYAEFLTEKLGIPTAYEKKDLSLTWKFLFDLSYFQGNIDYKLNGAPGKNQPTAVSAGELYKQDTEVKCADGSLLYTEEYRTRSQEAVDYDALIQTTNMFRIEYYYKPDAERVAIFEKWLQYMQAQGVNVIFILAPYPPIVYDHAAANPERYSGFFGTETTIRRLGKEYNIPVYGSYNPYAIPATSADFYDGLHPHGDCLARFFPGVPQALADRDAGVDVSLDYTAAAPDADGEAADAA